MSRTHASAFSPSTSKAAKHLDPTWRMFDESYLTVWCNPEGSYLQGRRKEGKALQCEDEAEKSSYQWHMKWWMEQKSCDEALRLF